MRKKPVTKAVIAAAGFGTRFLPQTKASPKEMLPLVDKPVIQYVVEELVAVGVQDIIIVTGYTKRAIEDHFDRPSSELIASLKQGGPSKEAMLKEVEKIANLANFIYVRQKGPYGNATPLINAAHLLNNEPFIFTWSDDFFRSKPLRFQQMIDAYKKYNCSVMSTIKISDPEDYKKYGVVGGKPLAKHITEITEISEKPGIDKAPSDQASVSGFLLTPDSLEYFALALKNLKEGKEFYANDALKLMIENGRRIIGCEIRNGEYFDLGNKLSYLKATYSFAMRDASIASELKLFLKQQLKV